VFCFFPGSFRALDQGDYCFGIFFSAKMAGLGKRARAGVRKQIGALLFVGENMMVLYGLRMNSVSRRMFALTDLLLLDY
jgi:hypothetical protein